MNFRELIKAAGIAERQMRYLIAEGFVPPPSGGRAHAVYGEKHLAAARRYMVLKNLGFPPAAIKLLLESDQGVPAPVAPGVTLIVAPKLIGSGTPTEPLVEAVRARLKHLISENTADDLAGED